MNFNLALSIAMIVIWLMVVGWVANDIYRFIMEKREINGMILYSDNLTEDSARSYAESRDTVGNWICVNIRGMTIHEMIATCEHESAHEIFAEHCEENATECLQKVGIK
jgi:hypothetical protein